MAATYNEIGLRSQVGRVTTFKDTTRDQNVAKPRGKLKASCSKCKALQDGACTLGKQIEAMDNSFRPLEMCTKPLDWESYQLEKETVDCI